MEKSIHKLLRSLSEAQGGNQQFFNIKGGLGLNLEVDPSTNDSCNNDKTCGGTNTNCTNYDCGDSTNKSPNCTNSHTCFM